MSEREGPIVLLVVRADETMQSLGPILSAEGYRVQSADTAAGALEQAEREAPDLVLFDARLADANTWARLQPHESLRDVPVLCCCAHPNIEGEDVTTPFGPCVDYVTAPVVPAEVRARVRRGIELGRLRRAAARSDTVSREFISMMAHDLRSPLASILLNLELLESEAELEGTAKDDVAYALYSARSLADIITMVQDVARFEAGDIAIRPEETVLTVLVHDALSRIAGPMTAREVKVEGDGDVAALCDPELTRRVIEQLLQGASSVTREEADVRVRIVRRVAWARVEVTDGGATIPEELRRKIFEKAGVLELRRLHRAYSRGLGPAFCKLAIEAQDGSIGASADPRASAGQGNTFWFELPLAGLEHHP